MSPRTPAAIFDEVLNLWDDLKRASLLSGRVPGRRDEAWFDAEMLRHTAQVHAYREEFRKAMHGPQVGTGSGTVVLSYDGPPPTLDAENPSGAAPPTREEVWDAIDRCSRRTVEFWEGVKGESVPDRAERLAARHTKDDGSAK